MQYNKLVKVLIPIHVKLSTKHFPKTQVQEEDMSNVPYASAVGSLMYAMLSTWPYITHVVGVLRRFISKPGKEHSTTLKWVFRYLHDTSDYGMWYQGRPRFNRLLDLHRYFDAYWVVDLDQIRSASGYVFNLFGGKSARWVGDSL